MRWAVSLPSSARGGAAARPALLPSREHEAKRPPASITYYLLLWEPHVPRHSCPLPGATQPRGLQGRQRQSALLLRLNRPKTFSGETIKCLAVREQGIPKWDCLLFPLGISVRKNRETGCFVYFFFKPKPWSDSYAEANCPGFVWGKRGRKKKGTNLEYLQKKFSGVHWRVWISGSCIFSPIHFPLITGAVAITQELNRGKKQCKSCKTPRAAGLSISFGRAAFICRHQTFRSVTRINPLKTQTVLHCQS